MKDEKIRESNLLKKKLVRKIFFTKKVLFILFTFCIISCQSEFDKYYEKPSWLDDNAYDVLKEKGNFNNYLKLADRTLYSKILHGSGSYTFFAPNDEAFTSYLKSNNYNSVDDIPLKLASEIISYSMVYNQYSSINLGDSWESSAQWNSGSSVRKKTPSYKGIYKELVNGDSVSVYDEYSTTFSEKNNDNRY